MLELPLALLRARPLDHEARHLIVAILRHPILREALVQDVIAALHPPEGLVHVAADLQRRDAAQVIGVLGQRDVNGEVLEAPVQRSRDPLHRQSLGPLVNGGDKGRRERLHHERPPHEAALARLQEEGPVARVHLHDRQAAPVTAE
eukprot:6818178-Pyramimonas_sp.AAC.1